MTTILRWVRPTAAALICVAWALLCTSRVHAIPIGVSDTAAANLWLPPRVNDDEIVEESIWMPRSALRSQATLTIAARWSEADRLEALVAVQVPLDRLACTNHPARANAAKASVFADGDQAGGSGEGASAEGPRNMAMGSGEGASAEGPRNMAMGSGEGASAEGPRNMAIGPGEGARAGDIASAKEPRSGFASAAQRPAFVTTKAAHSRPQRPSVAPQVAMPSAEPSVLANAVAGLSSESAGAGPSGGDPGSGGDGQPTSLGGSLQRIAPGATSGDLLPSFTPGFARACVRAAFRAAGLTGEDRYDSLASRARGSAALPELRLRIARTTDETGRVTYLDEETPRYATTGSATYWLEGRVSFRLDRILFADEELSIERLRIERAEVRNRVAAKVVKALSDWQRALAIGALVGLSPDERISARAAELEAAATLDVLTEGWFSNHMSESHKG